MGLGNLPTLTNRTGVVGNLPVNYADVGVGEPIVLLHGWGGQIASFGPVPATLGERRRVLALDLPGFGRTPLPDHAWGTADYAGCVAGFIEQAGVAPCVLVGHSFGGQIAIALAASRPELIRKLVLVDSAGIRGRRGLRYYYRVYSHKLARRLLSAPLLGHHRKRLRSALNARFGSADYRAASDPILRATLVRIVNEDQRAVLPRIQAPTLLIWGGDDADTPVVDGKLMEQLIPDAGLVVFEGAGHFSYLDRLDQFCRVVTYFVEH